MKLPLPYFPDLDSAVAEPGQVSIARNGDRYLVAALRIAGHCRLSFSARIPRTRLGFDKRALAS